MIIGPGVFLFLESYLYWLISGLQHWRISRCHDGTYVQVYVGTGLTYLYEGM